MHEQLLLQYQDAAVVGVERRNLSQASPTTWMEAEVYRFGYDANCKKYKRPKMEMQMMQALKLMLVKQTHGSHRSTPTSALDL